jgi:hypothetical protein
LIPAPRAAAKEVLGRALPHGYIIALLEDETATAWLSRLRDAPHDLDNLQILNLFTSLVVSRLLTMLKTREPPG